MRKDITNSFRHILCDHRLCEPYFCNGPKLNEVNYIDKARTNGLLEEFIQIVNRLAKNAESLLMNVDNNICEQFNSIISKHLSGKRINFSQRHNYNVRVEATLLSHNTSGKYIRTIHKTLVQNKSPGKKINNYNIDYIVYYRRTKLIECVDLNFKFYHKYIIIMQFINYFI